jgi:hypothetical protein
MSGTNADVSQTGLLATTVNKPAVETSQAGVLATTVNNPAAEVAQAGVLSVSINKPMAQASQAGVLATTVNNPAAEVAQAGILAFVNYETAMVAQAGVLSMVINNPSLKVSQAGALAFVTYTVAIALAEVAQAGVLSFVRYYNPPPPPPPPPPNPASNVIDNDAVSQNLTILVDENNDIYVDSSGNLAVGSGLTALIQICQAYLEAQLREMVYQYNQGMPTMDDVFQGNNIKGYIAAGRQRLMSITGVVNVASFTAQRVNNQLQYTAEILTIYSQSLVTITNLGVAT